MRDAQTIFQAAVDQALEAGEIGIQIAVYREGQPVADAWGGLADQDTGREVDGNTLFNAFSCCKAVTHTALHLQADRGLVDYEQPVARYWPEFAARGKHNCTVRDVLSHRGGLPQMPENVTPELMADFAWMTARLAEMAPLYEPGTTNAYHSYTQGWLVAEIVRRTDPRHRPFRQFVLDEIAAPLGCADVWMGVPESEEHRIATLYGQGRSESAPPDSLWRKVIPPEVDTTPAVWGRPAVWRNCIPGAGAHFTARSEARFWAMLAEGGALDGVRLFSREKVRSFTVPRPDTDLPDLTSGEVRNISTMGYWLSGSGAAVGSSPHLLCHPGAGNSIAWADPDNRIAVAVCHNRFGDAYDKPLARAMKEAFDIA